jgi:hypothetical protein
LDSLRRDPLRRDPLRSRDGHHTNLEQGKGVEMVNSGLLYYSVPITVDGYCADASNGWK